MNPFWQSVLVALITGGGIAGFMAIIQTVIKHKYDVEDRDHEENSESKKHGVQLDKLTSLVEEGNKAQEATSKAIEIHGEAIAGLEHDRIVHIGEKYIQKGSITLSEYDDIRKYLYEPYKKLGGNGTAEDVMNKLNEMVGKGED